MKSVYLSFGKVPVYLFGSRVDDHAIGGDIDLAIDAPDLTDDEFKQKKIKMLTHLLRHNFEIKVDVIPYNTQNALLNQEIRRHHVQL